MAKRNNGSNDGDGGAVAARQVTPRRHAGTGRWGNAAVGGAFATAGLGALCLALDMAGTPRAVLAVPAGMWLALMVFDYAWTPWRHAHADERAGDAAAALALPDFVDTQASWHAHEPARPGDRRGTRAPCFRAPPDPAPPAGSRTA